MRSQRVFAIGSLLLLLALISVVTERTRESSGHQSASLSQAHSTSLAQTVTASFEALPKPEGDVILWEGDYGCRGGGPDYRFDWIETDQGYVCNGITLGHADMERLRNVILATRESRDPLADFERLPTGVELSQHLAARHPWVAAEPPRFDELLFRKDIREAVNAGGGSTIGDYVDVQIKGEPEVSASFSLSVPFLSQGRLPTWTVSTRWEEWETQSPLIIAELAKWTQEPKGPVTTHQNWLGRFLESTAREEAVPWIEEYLRQNARTWPGADRFHMEVLSDKIPWQHRGFLELTPRFSAGIEAVDLEFDFLLGLPEDWTWLHAEIEHADQYAGQGPRTVKLGDLVGTLNAGLEGNVLKILWSSESRD